MRWAALSLSVLLALPAALRAAEPAAPALTAETFAALRRAVAPSEAECSWQQVGWRPTFGDAVAEARTTGKPIFLWAMNGHPLACV